MNETIQVPHAKAGSRADVGSTNFNDVFFAGGEGDVARLERERKMLDCYYLQVVIETIFFAFGR